MLLLLFQSTFGKIIHRDDVKSYPTMHRRVINEGEQWIINSSFSRTIFSLNSIPSDFPFTVRNGKEKMVLHHSADTTFQFLAGEKSSLRFQNLPTGTYGISSIGLGDTCSGDVYVSNQNWDSNPQNKEEKINCGSGKECCFFVGGVPSQLVNFQYLYTPTGYLTILESNGNKYNEQKTGHEQVVPAYYTRVSSSQPIMIMYKGISNDTPFFEITSYSTETLISDYKVTFNKGFTTPVQFKEPDLRPAKVPIYAIIIPVVFIVIVIAIIVGVVCYIKKKKQGDVKGKSSSSSNSSTQKKIEMENQPSYQQQAISQQPITSPQYYQQYPEQYPQQQDLQQQYQQPIPPQYQPNYISQY